MILSWWGWCILLKTEGNRKGDINFETGDWGTSAPLYFGLKKISCRTYHFLPCVFGCKKRIVFKSFLSMYFHLLIIYSFWFAYLWFRIEVKMHTKGVADVSWGTVEEGAGSCLVWGANELPGEEFTAGGLGGIHISYMLKLCLCTHIVVFF